MQNTPVLSQDELNSLGTAMTSFIALERAPDQKPLSPELQAIFDDFCLALTFPTQIELGEVGSRRRAAFLYLSKFWHTLHVGRVAATSLTLASIDDRVRLGLRLFASIQKQRFSPEEYEEYEKLEEQPA